jgi:hypothetical protein
MTDELPRTVDLNWIAKTLLNMQPHLRSLKDDMLVTAAVLNRLDNTESAILAELRSMRSQFDRMRTQHERLRDRVDALVHGPEREQP